MILFSDGAPLTPVGGSSWSLGKTERNKHGKGRQEGDMERWIVSKKEIEHRERDEKKHKDTKTKKEMERKKDKDGRVWGFWLTPWLQDNYQSKHELLYQHDFSRHTVLLPVSTSFTIRTNLRRCCGTWASDKDKDKDDAPRGFYINKCCQSLLMLYTVWKLLRHGCFPRKEVRCFTFQHGCVWNKQTYKLLKSTWG